MKKMFMRIKNYPYLLFTLVFVLIAILYNYHETTFKQPQSTHKWRQCDVASITLNYYQNGMNFFQPELHNQMADDLNSGYAVGEAPVMYYFVAILYKIFGPHDFIFRVINLIILFLGLLYLYKIFQIVLKNNFWAILGSLFVFTSPTYVYFANNFLTDPTAFSFCIIAWYQIVRFIQENKIKHFYFSMFWFSLAGLLKVLSFVNVVALFAIIFLEFVFAKKDFFKERYFARNYFHYTIALCFYLVLMVGWYWYSFYYNELHGTRYFFSETSAVWTFSKEKIVSYFQYIKKHHFEDYFHPITQFLFLALLPVLLLFRKKMPRQFLILVILFFLASVSVFVLWYSKFVNHDYYAITQLGFPVCLFLFLMAGMQKQYPNVFNAWYLKLAFLLFFSMNVYHAKHNVYVRYYGWMSAELSREYAYYHLEDHLRKMGIDRNEKVIVLPDFAPCFPLYLFNQKGYSGINPATRSADGIRKLIGKGAKYLIYRGNITKEHGFIKPFLNNKISDFHNLAIYNLTDKEIPYTPDQRIYESEAKFDLESISQNGKYFTEKDELMNVKGVEQRDSLFAYSGVYSIKLDTSNAFGLQGKIKKVKRGDVYEVKVKRLKSGALANLVVSDKKSKRFYLKTKIGKECISDSLWEELSLTFYLNKSLTNDELRFYVWNPYEQPAWFDDLKVKKVKFDEDDK